MNGLRNFIKGILWVELAAISGLLITGVILTWAESGCHYGETFFSYQIQHFNYLPAWFAASLMLMAINGFWMFRLANIEGFFTRHTVQVGGNGEPPYQSTRYVCSQLI